MYIEYRYGPKWPYLIYIAYIGLFGTGICRFIQVLYLGRAPRTKETLPDFREKCRVTRHSRVFRGLTGSQRTPGIGVSQNETKMKMFVNGISTEDFPENRVGRLSNNSRRRGP